MFFHSIPQRLNVIIAEFPLSHRKIGYHVSEFIDFLVTLNQPETEKNYCLNQYMHTAVVVCQNLGLLYYSFLGNKRIQLGRFSLVNKTNF